LLTKGAQANVNTLKTKELSKFLGFEKFLQVMHLGNLGNQGKADGAASHARGKLEENGMG
jgi:hypothetical protein